MTPLFNAVLKVIPPQIVLGLLIAAVAVAAFQTWRIGGIKGKLAVADLAVKQCVVTNDANSNTISELRSNTNACLEGRRADEKAHNNALVAWTVERQLLKVKADEKADNVVEVFRDPTCADFAKVNIANICPGMVDGLRRRAGSHNRVQDGN